MRFLFAFSVALTLVFPRWLSAAPNSDLEFKADFYERDLKTDTIRGKGHAWLRQYQKEMYADELSFDFTNRIAIGKGNVRVKDGEIDMWASYVRYNLSSDEAWFDDAIISSSQIVLTGAKVHRLDARRFEIDEGSYSNCNTEFKKGAEALQKCTFDWKIYGAHFSVTMEQYAHINDALFYVNGLPMMYFPYFIVPIKTGRQSGFLPFKYTYAGNLGSGLTQPYFLVLGPWQDVTFEPTWHTLVGYHLGMTYRYAYSDSSYGSASLYALQRRLSPNRANPNPDDTSRPRTLGFIGEWAVNVRNQFTFGERGQSRQILRLLSDPYLSYDYSADVATYSDSPSLRSEFSVTIPSDHWDLTAQALFHQPLIISTDTGVDRGAIAALPEITATRTTAPFWDSYLSYEFESRFSNFFRGSLGYDSLSATLNPTELVHSDPVPSYHYGDYIRTGQRLLIEPRLIANIPMPPGFQFQPTMRVGTLIYHFDLPSSSVIHQDYVQASFPLSMYLSRSFETNIAGFEKINHVFQPRVIYTITPYEGGNTSHPFFYQGPIGTDPTLQIANPRFDILDSMLPVQYMRFELINRFRKKSGSEINRFFLFQLSEQYNVRTFASYPTYAKNFGPIELLTDLQLWRLSFQSQGLFQLETTVGPNGPVREYELSSTITYQSPSSDTVSVGTRFSIKADDNATEKSLYLNWYKALPTFFDLTGGLEYNLKAPELSGLLGYSLGFVFAAKPRSCWGATLSVGRDSHLIPFVNFNVRVDFGQPGYAFRPN